MFPASPKVPTPAWTPDYDVEWLHDLSPEEQAQRHAADPQAPFARTSRPTPTAEETATLVASAANWLSIGQDVLITGTPVTLDGSAERRTGVIWRLCGAGFSRNWPA